MREYGQVQCSFWSDPDVQGLSEAAKLLAVYLMTGPHSNGIGCYRLPDGYIQADLGWTSQTVSKGFQELFRIGFAKRCETTFFVLIPKFLKWNPIANGNVAKAREKEFEAITKKASVYSELCASMLAYGNHWANGFETVLKGYAKQDPTQPIPNPEPEPTRYCEPETVSPPEAFTTKRRCQLPDDFTLTAERRAVLLEANRNANPTAEFAQFCDHHRGHGKTMLDWDAAWRTWCRNSVKFSRGTNHGSQSESPLDRVRAAYERECG